MHYTPSVSQQRFPLILVSGFHLRKAPPAMATLSPAQCGAFHFCVLHPTGRDSSDASLRKARYAQHDSRAAARVRRFLSGSCDVAA